MWLGPLYFIWWIEAKYKYTQRTLLFEFWLNNLGSQKWLLLKKYKCYKVSWGLKITATQYSTISLSVSKVERVLFHPLSSRFLKENHFSRGSCVGNFGTFGPKSALGSKNMWTKKFFKEKAIWRFLKKLCAAYSFKSASCNHSVTNLATRWRSTTPYSCKTLLVLTWTKV